MKLFKSPSCSPGLQGSFFLILYNFWIRSIWFIFPIGLVIACLSGLAVVGMLGFGPIKIALTLGLSIAEPTLLEMVGLPIHRLFPFLFAPSAFLTLVTAPGQLERG